MKKKTVILGMILSVIILIGIVYSADVVNLETPTLIQTYDIPFTPGNSIVGGSTNETNTFTPDTFFLLQGGTYKDVYEVNSSFGNYSSLIDIDSITGASAVRYINSNNTDHYIYDSIQRWNFHLDNSFNNVSDGFGFSEAIDGLAWNSTNFFVLGIKGSNDINVLDLSGNNLYNITCGFSNPCIYVESMKYYNGKIYILYRDQSVLDLQRIAPLYLNGSSTGYSYEIDTYGTVSPTGLSDIIVAHDDELFLVDYLDSQIHHLRLQDNTAPSVTTNTPTSYQNLTEPVIFNITVSEATNSSECNVTIDGGVSNYTLTTTNNLTYTHTNTTFTDGNYLAEFLCIDDSGNINNSESVNFTNDDTYPTITFLSPPDYSSFNYKENIPVNVSVSDNLLPLSACWWTNDSYVSNYSIVCGNNISVTESADGDYQINFCSNDSLGNTGCETLHYTVSQDKPAVTIEYPQNNSYLNSKTNDFNVTCTDSNGLQNGSLYSNFNGTFMLNVTNTSAITSGVEYNFTTTLSDGEYLFSFRCFDRTGQDNFAPANFTTTVDTIKPVVNVNTPNTPEGSQTISWTATVTDTNLDSCKYSIYNSSGGFEVVSGTTLENISMGSCLSGSATVSAYSTYTLREYGTDLASNEDYNEVNFTTSPAPDTPGGGGGSTIIIEGEKGWIMQVSDGVENYDIFMIPKTSRDLKIQFENTGESERTITLGCENINGNVCQYVMFEEDKVVLPVLKDTITEKIFSIVLPDEFAEGDYSFNIRGTDDNGLGGTVTVYLSVGGKGFFKTFFSKLVLRTKRGIPYLLVFSFWTIISLFAFGLGLPKKTPIKPIFVMFLSFTAGSVIVYLF